jgi:hypothetical protein
VYLIEDGLFLWLSVMTHTPSFSNELLQLFEAIPKIAASASEHIKLIMKITEEYLILGKAEFLKVYAGPLVAMFSSLIGNGRTQISY